MAKEILQSDKEFLEKFEPDVFWEQHSHRIMAGLLAVILAALGIFLWQKHTAERALEAAARLGAATDIPALENIIADFPEGKHAARARLQLADRLFSAGQVDAAEAQYQAFLSEFPEHSLVPTARVGLAAVAEAREDYDGALNQYQQLDGTGSGQYVAILAKTGAARCFEALDQPAQARQKYEEALALAQGSQMQSSIFLKMAILGREMPETDVAPEPAEILQENAPE